MSKAWLFVLWALLLNGCTSVGSWMDSDSSTAGDGQEMTESPDGPPLLVSVDVEAMPEPTPSEEPLARYGNPERYEVDGEFYEVKPLPVGFVDTGVASWYGRKFHGRLTSSGEPFDMFTFTAAHKTMPIPAWVRVTNLQNNRSLVVRVNDRGPFKPDRVLDLSWAAAKRLGFEAEGTASVRYELLTAPVDEPGLVANPLVTPAQAILQVTAVSDQAQAEAIAETLRSALSGDAGRVRVEPTGTGLYRVQVVPRADEAVIESTLQQLSGLGWTPQRLLARTELN